MDKAEIKTGGELDNFELEPDTQAESEGIALMKTADSEDSSTEAADDATNMESSDRMEHGSAKYHQANPEAMPEIEQQKACDFRKKLNRDAREIISASIHKRVKLIVHRPEYNGGNEEEYKTLNLELMPVVREIARKTLPLLEHETSSEFARNQLYGSKFQADSVVYQDYRYFAKKRPPAESPSLVVGLRVDESASMAAFGRLTAAKRAVLAVYEFCQMCHIPILIYGDTADVSKMEMMSIYAYTDFDLKDPNDRYRLMGIRARSNNRDGMALRIIAERLLKAQQSTKLLISISDGQPKSMENYSGHVAIQDMQMTIAEYERKGITFLAAAIGQDKEVISQIYGLESFMDITNLRELPAKLVRIIARKL